MVTELYREGDLEEGFCENGWARREFLKPLSKAVLEDSRTPLLGRGSHSFQLWLCEPPAPGHFFPKRQKKLLHFHSNKRQRPEAAGLKGEQPSNSSESSFSEEKPFPASSFPPLPCTATCALPECWAVRISLLMKQSGLRLLSLQSQPRAWPWLLTLSTQLGWGKDKNRKSWLWHSPGVPQSGQRVRDGAAWCW